MTKNLFNSNQTKLNDQLIYFMLELIYVISFFSCITIESECQRLVRCFDNKQQCDERYRVLDIIDKTIDMID